MYIKPAKNSLYCHSIENKCLGLAWFQQYRNIILASNWQQLQPAPYIIQTKESRMSSQKAE